MYIPTDLYQSILQVTPILCVDVLIIADNKCLLLMRNNDPVKGTYWFPGGRIYKNELIEQAAIRKAKEETNLDCTFGHIVSIEQTLFEKQGSMLTDAHTVNICCLLNAGNTSNLVIDKLHSDFKWVDKLDDSYHPAVNHPLSMIGFI